jgi:hypothetical protein
METVVYERLVNRPGLVSGNVLAAQSMSGMERPVLEAVWRQVKRIWTNCGPPVVNFLKKDWIHP